MRPTFVTVIVMMKIPLLIQLISVTNFGKFEEILEQDYYFNYALFVFEFFTDP